MSSKNKRKKKRRGEKLGKKFAGYKSWETHKSK